MEMREVECETLSVAEFARTLGVSTRYVWDLINDGAVGYLDFGRRKYRRVRIPKGEVASYIVRNLRRDSQGRPEEVQPRYIDAAIRLQN